MFSTGFGLSRFKNLNIKAAADKALLDKELNIVKNPKYDGCQRGIGSIVYKFFNERTSCITAKNEIISNKELAEELGKPILTKEKCTHIYRQYLRH